MATSNEINEFNSNAQELTSKFDSFAKTAKKIGNQTLADLRNLTRSSTTAIQSSADEVEKWNSAISSSFNMLHNGIGSITYGPTQDVMTAVQTVIKIADSLVGGVLQHVSSVLKLQDSVSQIGVSATMTTADLVKMSKEAGFSINRASKLMDSFSAVGSSLTFLAPTTGEATKRLAKVFDNREDQLKYLKQGLDPEVLMKYQAEGVKYLTGFGVQMGEDDRSIRKSTLAYVDTLTTLSVLTGESRDEVAKKLASQKSDVGYQIKMRELIKSGNSKAADEFSTTLGLLRGVSPELEKGMADFITNGEATTVEGKKMMLVMGSKAREIAKEVEEGRMTGAEAAREVAIHYKAYMKKNERVLTVSTDLQKASGTGGKVLEEVDRLSGIKSEADAKKLMEEKAREPDKTINAKNEMYNAERVVSLTKDELMNKTMPLALAAFKTLAGTVKDSAFIMAQFAQAMTGGKYSENFEKIMLLVGNKDQIKEMKNKADKELGEVEAKIDRIKTSDNKVKLTQERVKQADINYANLTKKGAPEAEKQKAINEQNAAREAEAIAKTEQEKIKESGVTVEDLETQKSTLLERRTNIEKRLGSIYQGEAQEQAQKRQEGKAELLEKVMNVDLSEARQYIQFTENSGDEQHWALLAEKNPELAKRITMLGKEYFLQTKQKLILMSAVRTYEEQKRLYDGWLAAGGDKELRPTVNVPGIGNVSMPANPDLGDGPHTRGVGVDISKAQLDWLEGKGLLQGMGLRRPYRNDPVHVEKAKFGSSMIKGKEIEMHGREALIELFNGTIPINLPPDFKENTFSEIKDTIKPKFIKPDIKPKTTTTESSDLDLDLLDRIDSQFDDLISSMDKSNLLQHDIKTYMAA